MTIDELFEHLCPFDHVIPKEAYRKGFMDALVWFFEHEKLRHEADIRDINNDLENIGKHNVDLSRIREYVVTE